MGQMRVRRTGPWVKISCPFSWVQFNSDSGSKLGQDMRKPETYRNEIKSYIIRTGMTMTEVVDYLSDEYGWSRSVPNLSGKLKRGSLRYGEAVELADALGYDIVWEKR